MDNGLIPCFGGIVFFVLLFALIAFFRFLRYRETMLLAEKGLVRPMRERGSDGKDTLRWGIVITAIGLALSIGIYPFGFLLRGSPFPLGFGPWMLVGLLPTFFGLGLILIYVLTYDRAKKEKDEGEPPVSTQI